MAAELKVGGTVVAAAVRTPLLETAAGDLVVQPAGGVVDFKSSVLTNVAGITGPVFNVISGTLVTVGDAGFVPVVALDTTGTPNACYTTRAYVTAAATVSGATRGASYEVVSNTVVDAGAPATSLMTKQAATTLGGTSDAQVADSGANIEVQVRGIAGETIKWEAVLYYDFQVP